MKHISYSELKTWAECPWKHKLSYIERVRKFIGNEFTAFGRAIHAVCENVVVTEQDDISGEDFFDFEFRKELKALNEVELDKKLVVDMQQQAHIIIPQVEPYLKAHFGSYEVFSVEERLYEGIDFIMPIERKFKGFIDLVIKTDDGKYHVIDWKSCSWGWKAEKKADRLITYQLTLYKKFFCEKHDIDPSMVETHFALLKRTAKQNNVEIFRVTSGERKTGNATKLLSDAIRNIEKQNFVKNRKSCDYCEFNNTEHCKR
jgi:ATP-dependent exoDNAse (exonuclease V) beta subunit